MSEASQQNEPVAAAGDPVVEPQTTGDADFDAALAEAAKLETPEPTPEPVEPVAEPEPVTPPAQQDFTFTTLQNGERELRLATGEVYRGKDDNAIIEEIAKSKLESNRYIQTLKQAPPPQIAPPAPAVEAPDPTAMALADLMAPAFGVKSGNELIDRFNEIYGTATKQQEMVQQAQIQQEIQQFVAAVPSFSRQKADGDKIDAYLNERGLPGNAATWEMAYHTLAAKGELSAPAPTTPTNVIRMPDGKFAPAPKTQQVTNLMPPPPTGNSPATTGKGQTTETDLWNMTAEQLESLIQEQSAKSA